MWSAANATSRRFGRSPTIVAFERWSSETGYVWTWLSEARDPSMIAPGRILVVGDDDAIAMASVVDLVEHENGRIIHVEILPGTVAEVIAPAKPNPPGRRLRTGWTPYLHPGRRATATTCSAWRSTSVRTWVIPRTGGRMR